MERERHIPGSRNSMCKAPEAKKKKKPSRLHRVKGFAGELAGVGGGGEECWREVGQGLKRVLSRVLKRKREDVISRSLNAGLRRFPVVTET